MQPIKNVRNIMMLSILYALLFTPYAKAQEKINLAAGIGFPELINVGVRFQTRHDTRQIALSLGFAAGKELALTGDMFFHFGGYSRFSERQPWYVRGGVTLLYSGSEEEDLTELAPVFNLRLGRDFNFSEKVGLNLDVGIAVSPFVGLLYDEYNFMPGFGFAIFYRI